MGCWNDTCLITNLPIHSGDPVIAFVISYDNYEEGLTKFSGSCYSTDIAFPITLPIKAEYNDYGSVGFSNGYIGLI